ncbi:MAG: TIGR03000 domain-containing protein [Planctomycetia bacterium]|nr:TIGR03000 domain-containing protein [Planctomycetia bacterium]
MKLCKATCLLLFISTIFACSQADAFFGRNRALPSAVYFANYNDPYYGSMGPFAGYEADTAFILPSRGRSPFNYRYWNNAVAAPVIENGYAVGIVNGCYNAEYEPCCGEESYFAEPVFTGYYAGVDAYFPAPRSFQPIRNTFRAIKSLFCHKQSIYCDPCFACCDPCVGFDSCCGEDDANIKTMNDGIPATTTGTIEMETSSPTRVDSSVLPTPTNQQQADPNGPIIGPDQLLTPQSPLNNNQTGVLRMTVPADSIVYINGYQTKLTGTERNFTANDLIAGQTYHFEIRVVAVRNGQTLEEVKTASLIAGSTSSIAFSDFENQGLQEIALLK